MDNPTPADGTRLSILLADDHEPFRARMRKLLHNTPGVELLEEAGNGEEAVRLATELKPDIVFMDVVMPRLNGIEATRQITREFPSIKVIALTLHGDSGFRRAMLDAGATAYLLKDNVGHELTGVLRSILAGAA